MGPQEYGDSLRRQRMDFCRPTIGHVKDLNRLMGKTKHGQLKVKVSIRDAERKLYKDIKCISARSRPSRRIKGKKPQASARPAAFSRDRQSKNRAGRLYVCCRLTGAIHGTHYACRANLPSVVLYLTVRPVFRDITSPSALLSPSSTSTLSLLGKVVCFHAF